MSQFLTPNRAPIQKQIVTVEHASEQSKICTVVLVSAIMLSCKAFPPETEEDFQRLHYDGKDNKVSLADFLSGSSKRGKRCRILPLVTSGGNKGVATLWRWISGLCEAIELKYLRSVHISLHWLDEDDLPASKTIAKSYTLTYEYGSDIEIRLSNSHDGISEEKTLGEFKGELQGFFETILLQLHDSRPLESEPAPHYNIKVHLKFTEICPSEYQVPGFLNGGSEVRKIIRNSANPAVLSVESDVHSFAIGCSDSQEKGTRSASASLESSATAEQDFNDFPLTSGNLQSTQKLYNGMAHNTRSPSDRITQLVPSNDDDLSQLLSINPLLPNRQRSLASASSDGDEIEVDERGDEVIRFLREHTNGSNVILDKLALALEVTPEEAYDMLENIQQMGALKINSRHGTRKSGNRPISFAFTNIREELKESRSASLAPIPYRKPDENNRTTNRQMLPPQRTLTPEPQNRTKSRLSRTRASAMKNNISPSQTSETASTNSPLPSTPDTYNVNSRKRPASTETPESQLGSLKKTSSASLEPSMFQLSAKRRLANGR